MEIFNLDKSVNTFLYLHIQLCKKYLLNYANKRDLHACLLPLPQRNV